MVMVDLKEDVAVGLIGYDQVHWDMGCIPVVASCL